MQVIAFMNMKGGVGKTTLAVNVAFTLAAHHGKKVMIVDCDPQFNASQCLLDDKSYLAHIQDPAKGTLKDVFMPRQAGIVNTTTGTAKPINKTKMGISECTIRVFEAPSKPGTLDLLPSTLTLIEVQHSRRQTETRLKTWLKEKAGHYDYVIIDCPQRSQSLRKRQFSPAINISSRSSQTPFQLWDSLSWSVTSRTLLRMLE